MIRRYQDSFIQQLTEPNTRHLVYQTILGQVALEREHFEMVPPGTAATIFHAPPPSELAVAEREKLTRHDVAAYVDEFTATLSLMGCKDAARLAYWGFTSSDLVDTANGILMKRAWIRIHGLANALASSATGQDYDPPRIGRTHGQKAYVVPTYDAHHRMAGNLRGVLALRSPRFFGKLSGPTGQHNPPMLVPIEEKALAYFGLERDVNATQITSRVWYADFAFTCTQLVSICEQFALQIRLRAQDGIAELQEDFGRDQKGSSAMPHKRNPITAERISGLARVARGMFQPLMETHGAMWDQRDISNSSVERVALWDLLELTAYVLNLTGSLVAGLLIWNDEEARTWTSSADELNRLIGEGIDRDTAYGRLRGEDPRPEGVAQAAGDADCDRAAEEPAGPADH